MGQTIHFKRDGDYCRTNANGPNETPHPGSPPRTKWLLLSRSSHRHDCGMVVVPQQQTTTIAVGHSRHHTWNVWWSLWTRSSVQAMGRDDDNDTTVPSSSSGCGVCSTWPTMLSMHDNATHSAGLLFVLSRKRRPANAPTWRTSRPQGKESQGRTPAAKSPPRGLSVYLNAACCRMVNHPRPRASSSYCLAFDGGGHRLRLPWLSNRHLCWQVWLR
jgi:hypothetical protein